MAQHVDVEANTAHWLVTETHFAFRNIHLGQLLTLYYFAFFIVILPLLGLFERPRKTPESIEADFMAKAKAKKARPQDGVIATPAE
jgi:hypothetical protein